MDDDALIDGNMIEKITLAKRLGYLFTSDLSADYVNSVKLAALRLAEDPSPYVREVLAHSLRHCRSLPTEIADKIAADISQVAGSFLLETRAYPESEWLRVIPKLKDANLSFIACRPDLTAPMQMLLARVGAGGSVTSLVRNDSVILCEEACKKVIDRFGDNVRVMDQLSARTDLAMPVTFNLLNRVSKSASRFLINQYALDPEEVRYKTRGVDDIWHDVRNASPARLQSVISKLDMEMRLSDDLIAAIGERGGTPFFTAALAYRAALPIDRVHDMLSLRRGAQFVQLLRMAGVDDRFGPRFLRIAKDRFAASPSMVMTSADTVAVPPKSSQSSA